MVVPRYLPSSGIYHLQAPLVRGSLRGLPECQLVRLGGSPSGDEPGRGGCRNINPSILPRG